MSKVKFGDIVKDVKINVDRDNNPYEFYVAGDHMDSEDLNIRRRGRFATDDVGPAFTRIFKKGQVLYGSRRTYLKKVAVADFDGICANTTFVFESKDPAAFEQKLLPFLMLSEGFTNWSIAHSKGSTNPYVLFSDLASYEFDLPSLAEQKVLAEKLWAAYEVKQSYLKMIAATEEMVKSQFIEMFGDDLIDNCRWNVFPMEQVFDISSSRRVLKEEWTTAGVPFLRVRDMVDLSLGKRLNNEAFVSEDYYNNLKDEDGKLKPGDIIISATSTIGKCYLIKENDRFYYKDADVLRFRKKMVINSAYFMYAFNMPSVAKQVEESIGKTTVGHFLISKAQKIIMPIPPMDLQNRFEMILNQSDKSISDLRKSVDAIDKVIKSLINENL